MAWGNVENSDWTRVQVAQAGSITPDVATLSPAEGDGLAIAIIIQSGTGAGGQNPLSSGMTGWTLVGSQATLDGPKIYLYEKEAGASESNPTATLSNNYDAAAYAFLFPGDFNSGTIVDQHAFASGDSLEDSPSIDPTDSPSTVFSVVGDEWVSDWDAGEYPAGMSLVDEHDQSARSRWYGAAYEDYAVSDATGILDWNLGGGGRRCLLTFNVLPAATGAALALTHQAYDADGYSPDSLLANVQGIASGDTWQIIQSTVSPANATVEDHDAGDFTITPPAGYVGVISFQWALLDASDTERNPSNFADNGVGGVRVTDSSHPYASGDWVYLQNVGGLSGVNGMVFQVNVIEANNYDLVGSTYSGAYTSGGDVVQVAVSTHTHTVASRAYPSTSEVPRRTRVTPILTVTAELMDDGTYRSRDTTAQRAYRIDINHPLVSDAQRTTLDDFISTNLYGSIDIDAPDGNTYRCLLQREVAWSDDRSPVYYDGRISLVGNRI